MKLTIAKATTICNQYNYFYGRTLEEDVASLNATDGADCELQYHYDSKGNINWTLDPVTMKKCAVRTFVGWVEDGVYTDECDSNAIAKFHYEAYGEA